MQPRPLCLCIVYTYFMKFTIQHVVYVIKQSVSPKMLTKDRLFTIQAFTIGRVHCMYIFYLESLSAIEVLLSDKWYLFICFSRRFGVLNALRFLLGHISQIQASFASL